MRAHAGVQTGRAKAHSLLCLAHVEPRCIRDGSGKKAKLKWFIVILVARPPLNNRCEVCGWLSNNYTECGMPGGRG